jgi:gliding motility-associated-like protein
VTVNPLPEIFITPPVDTLCKDSVVMLVAGGAQTYNWSPGWGIVNTSNDSAWMSPVQTMSYTVTGVDINGCVNSESIEIGVVATPIITLRSQEYICNGDALVLDAGYTPNASYYWSGGPSGNQFFQVPFTNIPTFYSVTVKNDGCAVTDSILVIPGTRIFVPNAFSPHDMDLINDIFLAKADPEPIEFHMTIYTRWGEKVFESDNINLGWNGQYDGKLCQGGVYIWHITYTAWHICEDGMKTKAFKTGNVLLIE